ncbi:MAG: DNA-3-methyladenine glycosylase [Terriglobia bacterium]|jgi:DNA-3-methyladenine glycosylase II
MIIHPRAPFNFAQTLRFILAPPALLNGRQFAPLLDYFVEGEYRRVMELGEQLILYGVREEGPPANPLLRIRILAGPDDDRARGAVAGEVARQFSTDLDLQPFYALAEADPVLRQLIGHFRGMRVPQAPRVFEILISAIIEQQVNLSFAHKVKKVLIDTYGRGVDFEGRRYSAFPEPAALAITTPRELLPLQVSGPKARYIIAISRLVLDGTLDLENLRQLEPALAHEKLLELKGVGHWTAQYVGLRALRHLDCLPAADVGLQKVIQHFYALRKRPTPERVQKMARAWRGWRSYATFYLWLTYWENAEWKSRVREEIRRRRRL